VEKPVVEISDNKYKRRPKIIDEPLVEIPDKYKGPTLIIGGSDGSGTRVFADYVRRLGVPMRVDDQETLDVHGTVMFHGAGWPPLGNLILNATHSANYELDDLSKNTLVIAKEEINKLKSTFDVFESRLYRKYPNVSRAAGVSVGFKAPITMTLLPLLKDAFGRIKYVHVVRDGRDVSLSTNKSPIQKFYQSMYPDNKERMAKYSNSSSEPVLAMHLWSDWNIQALEWEEVHSSDEDFDFLVMRSEDLLDPVKKYESLVRLAEFVKSPITAQQLCCMSRENVVDMGQSLRSSENAAGDYRQRGVTRRQWNLASVRSHLGGKKKQVKARLKAGTANRRLTEAESNYHDEHQDDEGLDEEDDDDDHDAQELLSEYQKRIADLGKRIGDRGIRAEEGKRGETKNFFSDFKKFSLRHTLGFQTTATAGAADAPDESPEIQKRYGKWREMLKDDPDLSSKLHQEGAKGLAKFGYEPQTNFYNSPSSTNGFACDETVVCDDIEAYQGITLSTLFFAGIG
jgi:hypothetical protein